MFTLQCLFLSFVRHKLVLKSFMITATKDLTKIAVYLT